MKPGEGETTNFEDSIPFDEGYNIVHQDDGKV